MAGSLFEFVRYHSMRTSMEMATDRGPFPAISGTYSVLVEAVSGAGRLVVEQSMYWDAGGQAWAAGIARPAQALHD